MTTPQDRGDAPVDAAAVQAVLTAARRRLEGTRAAILESTLGSLRDRTGELVDHDDHLADAASDTYEAEAEASVLADLDAELAEIERAEARLRAGTYGRCETCAGPIGTARLDAVPWTSRCLADQLQAEQLDRSFRSQVLHGPAEAEATHNILLVTDLEAPDDRDVLAAEEQALHVDRTSTS